MVRGAFLVFGFHQELGILPPKEHGADFVRLSMHLHQRARAEMHIVAADLQFLHGAYSLSADRYEDVVASLSHELAMTRNLNLTRLREAPAAVLALFQ